MLCVVLVDLATSWYYLVPDGCGHGSLLYGRANTGHVPQRRRIRKASRHTRHSLLSFVRRVKKIYQVGLS
jgi:hypothetical protein